MSAQDPPEMHWSDRPGDLEVVVTDDPPIRVYPETGRRPRVERLADGGLALVVDTNEGVEVGVHLGDVAAYLATTRSRFKIGDRVRVARRVEHDSAGRNCRWNAYKTALLGCEGRITDVDPDDLALHLAVAPDDVAAQTWWYSPEALDLA